MNETDGSRLLTIKQAAERLHVSARTLRRWYLAGEGPKMIKLSERRIGIRLRDFDAWLAERPDARP
jgi:excisionase family DNA binding protein